MAAVSGPAGRCTSPHTKRPDGHARPVDILLNLEAGIRQPGQISQGCAGSGCKYSGEGQHRSPLSACSARSAGNPGWCAASRSSRCSRRSSLFHTRHICRPRRISLCTRLRRETNASDGRVIVFAALDVAGVKSAPPPGAACPRGDDTIASATRRTYPRTSRRYPHLPLQRLDQVHVHGAQSHGTRRISTTCPTDRRSRRQGNNHDHDRFHAELRATARRP